MNHFARRTEVLITVRAYPEPSKKYRETSCVAGVDLQQRRPIRLFPVVARATQIKKFSIIDVDIKRTDDPRIESHRIDEDSLRHVRQVPTGVEGWAERNRLIEPLRTEPSIECLRERFALEKMNAPSLALIRPQEITGIKIRRKLALDWTENEKLNLNRPSLFDGDDPRIPLQFVPYTLRYQFRCDDSRCKGHDMEALDWEASEALRNWPRKYGPEVWESKVRQKFLDEMLERDTQFYMGTMKGKPWVWTIIGIYYPPRLKDAPLQARTLPLEL